MAKASSGQAAPAKVKAPAPAVPVRKKVKSVVPVKNGAPPASAKKTAAKMPAGKMPAGKMASATKTASTPGKAAAKAPPAKPAAAKGRSAAVANQPAAKMAAPTPAPTAGARKVALAKAAPPKATSAKTGAPKAAAGRSAAGKSAARKPSARAKTAAKTVAVKQAAPRRANTRVAVPTPAARRGRSTAAPRKTPAASLARKLAGAPQVFTVSHLNEADFKADGLRAYAHYRDLGIAVATGGLCQAHVIRMVPPCTDEVRKRHLHQTELQLVYVLKGWMKNEFEGHGEQMMSTGSCWLQPSGIRHTVLDYSADCEVLEIIVPANFKTEDGA